ncbi:hypothetical protein [Nitrosopumilus sp. S4]
MNICEDRHIPKYLVTYKPAMNGQHNPKWLVCEGCLATRKCFGDESDIEAMEIIA